MKELWYVVLLSGVTFMLLLGCFLGTDDNRAGAALGPADGWQYGQEDDAFMEAAANSAVAGRRDDPLLGP